jgi:hypothetical protein
MKYVAHNGEMKNAYKNLVGKPKETKPLGRPIRRMILSMILRKSVMRVLTGFSWSMVGCCEHDNEPSGFNEPSRSRLQAMLCSVGFYQTTRRYVAEDVHLSLSL